MDIFGISLSKGKYSDILLLLTQKLEKQTLVYTPNPEILLLAKKDIQYKNLLLSANYLLPDGIGLYIAYQILDNSFPILLNYILLPYYIFNVLFRKKLMYQKYGERICGSDITNDILKYCNEQNLEIAVVDLYNPNDEKKQGAQAVFVKNFLQYYPNIKLRHYIWTQEKSEEIISGLQNSETVYLFSTLGMKRQEENVAHILQKCPNIKMGIGVGSAFDYITGFQQRPPYFIRKLGFEWLYRLFFGPQKIKRLKRLWNAVAVFIFQIYISKGNTK